jgi:outer membrane autotransporter protein
MRQFAQKESVNLGKLTVLTLALSSALAAMVPAQAAVITTPQMWTSGNFTNASTDTISTGGSNAVLGLSGTLGTLSNSGTIASNLNAIVIGAHVSSVLNSGSLIGGYAAIQNAGQISILNNSGRISSSSSYGIINDGTIGTLINSGFLSGNSAALQLTSTSTLSSFTNTGTIAGSIINLSTTALTINGGTGTIFGTLTGSINSGTNIGTIDSVGNVIFGSGNQLLNDNISVNSGSGTVTNSGVLQVNNPVTITGNYVQDSGASLIIGVSSTASFGTGLTDTGYGRLVVNGNAVIASGSTVTLKTLGYSFAQGQRYVVVASNGGGTNYNASTLVYSASGYSVTGAVQTDSGNSSYSDLILTLGAASAAGDTGGTGGGTSSTSPINTATTSNAVSSLSGLFKYSGTDAALLAVFNPAAALGSTSAANKAGAQLSPVASTASASTTSTASSSEVVNVVGAHVDGLRLAQAGTATGVSTGEHTYDIALWGQAFGGKANQSERDNVSGYYSNYKGVLLGADTLINPQWRVGGLFSYANTALSNTGDNTGSSASADSYGLMAYGGYTAERYYLDFSAGLVAHRYKTVRVIDFTGFSGTADSSFNGTQYISSVHGGYPIKLDALASNTTLTPLAGLTYSHLRQNGYSETGGNGAALNVSGANSSSLKSELGAKLERTYASSYGEIVPSVQLGWRHEFHTNAQQLTASYISDTTGSTSFTTLGASGISNTGVMALALTLVRSANLTVAARYKIEAASGYTAQTADVRVRYQF